MTLHLTSTEQLKRMRLKPRAPEKKLLKSSRTQIALEEVKTYHPTYIEPKLVGFRASLINLSTCSPTETSFSPLLSGLEVT